ncbi:type IV secretion protein Rhs [Amycolatopsis sp. H6(2020)]|nr:type IV secretion protein Rhs [Amycolatopsis sp. H6(2020)]
MVDGNPLVAQAQSQTTGVTGIGIAESAVDLANGVSDGSWVEAGLGAVGVGLEVLSMVVDPIGTLASYGVSWLIEHVQPLKEALDWLAGDPPVIQSFSDTWANVAAEVNAIAGDLTNEVTNGTAGWQGKGAEAYRGAAAEQADALAGAASLADGISAGVMIMGTVVAAVRELVRDLVAELVGKLITWALEAAATLGFATPAIAVQATTAITKTITKISDFIRKLIKTIGNVSPKIRKIIDKLGEIIEKLSKTLRKGSKPGGGTTPSAAKSSPKSPDTTPNSPDTTPSSTDTTPDGGSGPGSSGRGDGSLNQADQDPVATSKNKDCRFPGLEPIDLATGEMYLTQFDFSYRGLPAFVLQRVHLSGYRAGRLYGPTWASTLDQRLEVDDNGVRYAGSDGEILIYPVPGEHDEVWPAEGARWPLRRTPGGQYAISQPETGRTLRFAGAGVAPIVAIEDRNGNRIEFDYDAVGALVAVRHPGGWRIEVATDRGLVTGLWLAAADVPPVELVRYRYDDARRLVEVVNSSGRALHFDYDAAGRVVRWVDRNGQWYGYEYDSSGRCVRTEGSGGALSGRIEFDVERRITREINSLGEVTEHHFNELRQRVCRIDPLGGESRFTWDRYNRQLSETDPLGRVTTYERNQRGDVIRIGYPDGTESRIRYNEQGLPVESVHPDGSTRAYDYDARGNRTKVTDPVGASATYTYDDRGFLIAKADHARNVTRIEPDNAGLPIAITDPLGGTTRYRRDQFGRVISVTDPMGGQTRLGWTVEGKLLFRTRPDGTTQRWSYDAEGNETESIDPNGNRTKIEFTHFDFVAAQTGPDDARLEFGYDTEMRLISLRNPVGLEWRHEYDPAGNLVAEVDFNGRRVEYRRDAAGQLVERVNGAGEVTQFRRDTMGRIVERRCGDDVATFSYDAAGRLVRAVNAHAEVALDRDAAGRVLAETVNGRTVRSTYDALGRRTHRRTPSGVDSEWSYDATHRPAKLRLGGRTMSFRFDEAGREVERLLDTGTVFAQTWTPTHRLDSQTVSTVAGATAQSWSAQMLQQRRYHYRADGHVTAVEDGTQPRAFTLNPAGRVTQVSEADSSERYSYAPDGRIDAAVWPGGSAGSLGLRRYEGTLLAAAGDAQYTYDRQGRLIRCTRKRLSAKPDTWRYRWDGDDRLVAVTTPDGTRWRYLYDPLGRRIAKQRMMQDGTVVEQTDFAWDGNVLVEQISDNTRATVWEHTPSGTRVLAQVERTKASAGDQDWVDERFFSIVTDLVGSPTEMFAPDGNLAWRRRQTLWGEDSASGDAAGTPLRFPGQYHDAETGLHYNNQRYYDPTTGRYLSNDPLGLDGGFDPQAYVPNPVTWLDPLGLSGDDTCPPGDVVSLYKAPQHGLGQQQYDHGWSASDYGDPRNSPYEYGAFFAREPELANIYAPHYGEGVIEVRIPADEYAEKFADFEQPYPDDHSMTEVEIPGPVVEDLNSYDRDWHRPTAPTNNS